MTKVLIQFLIRLDVGVQSKPIYDNINADINVITLKSKILSYPIFQESFQITIKSSIQDILLYSITYYPIQ